MNRRRLLRATALLLPGLLLWIAIAGELNRSLDRSAGVRVPVHALAIVGNSYSGPRLQLSAEILHPRPVKEQEFPPGSDLFMRYRRTGGEWKFDGARRHGSREWSESVIDIPARAELKRGDPLIVEAVPLLPADFAISRSTVSQVRSKAKVVLTLRRGALGDVWVESGVQTGDSLGYVSGLIDRAGGAVAAFGSIDRRLDPNSFATAGNRGWFAKFADGKLNGFTELTGQPLESVQLTDGSLEIETREGNFYNSPVGFALVRVGASPARPQPLGQFKESFLSLDSDGTVWTTPFVAPRSTKLIHYKATGERLAEVAFGANITPVTVQDGTLVGRNGDAVIRCRLEHDRFVETDRWNVEAFSGAFPDAGTIIAAGSRAVVRLTTGVREPVTLFVATSEHPVLTVDADDSGDLVISTTARTTNDADIGRIAQPQHFWLLPKNGQAVDLGDVGATSELDYGRELPTQFTKGQRVLLHGNNLYVASGSQILGFDLARKSLALRVVEREMATPKRIL